MLFDKMCEECGKWFPRTEMFPYINIFGENTKAYLCPNCYKIRKEKIEFGITVKRMKELENDIRNNGAWNIVSSFIHKHIDYFNGDEKSSKLYKSERKKLSNLLKQKYNINTELDDDDSILYGNEFSNFMFEVAKRPEFMQKKQKKDFEELETFEREILSQDIRTEDFKESKASTLLGFLGVVVAISSFVIGSFGEEWKVIYSFSLNLPNEISLFPSIIVWSFILAISHLLLSIWYSLKVIVIAEFSVITPQEIRNCIVRFSSNYYEKLASLKIENIKLNQPYLQIKSNWVYVAQRLFKRGVLFLGTGAFLLLLYRLT